MDQATIEQDFDNQATVFGEVLNGSCMFCIKSFFSSKGCRKVTLRLSSQERIQNEIASQPHVQRLVGILRADKPMPSTSSTDA